MSEKYQNKYRIPSARLQHWNYGWNAAYFVTICTKDREHYFGEIKDDAMQLSEIGLLANKFWLEIPDHFPSVILDAFVVMPNHIHGIILIDKRDDAVLDSVDPVDPVETRHCLVSTIPGNEIPDITIPENNKKTIGQTRFQNPGKNTLSSIIGSYKSVVTKYARQVHADFAWQTRFHDHIIRDNSAHEKIAHYILNNPFSWPDDKFYG